MVCVQCGSTPRLVARLGIESGSTIATISIFGNCLRTLTIASVYYLYFAKPFEQSPEL